jgi:TolB-like protein/DNA-binding winged helix-turn-helix (wHTH) protein/Flp pilus assembly protein TadD
MPTPKTIIQANIRAIRSLNLQGDFRIGPWLIRPQLHTIALEGRVSHVEPKAMQVLVYLAEHPDEVVAKERLIRAVWADTFVSDDVLTRCISELRRAFDDDAKEPRVIETIPRSGYRLVASVQAAAPESAARRVWPRRWLIALSGALGLASIVIALGVGGLRGRLMRTSPATRIQSLAVLPLENLSRDPEQDYFADGMTEELITDLAKINALHVISRTSAVHYKRSTKTLPQIAQELGVDAVIIGTVQRSGNRVRISAQLVAAGTDRHLWAESYERDVGDVLALQGEVASAIAEQIRVKLTPQEKARLTSIRPVNPQAQEAYLRGLFFFNFGHDNLEVPRGVEALRRSIEYYQQAIKLDPNYAQAFAGLARACHWLANVERPVELYEQSIEAAKRALQLDEGLAEGHAALGRDLYVYKLDWSGAEREYKRAIELNPGYGEAHHGYSFYLAHMGRLDEAVTEINRAVDLDPLAVEQRANAGLTYTIAGDYDRGIEYLQSALEVSPHSAQYRVYLGTAYALKGSYPQALAEIRTAMEKATYLGGFGLATPRGLRDDPRLIALIGWVDALSGHRGEALGIARQLGTGAANDPEVAEELAGIYAALGDKDQAFLWLERTYQLDRTVLGELKCAPELENLRSDPRFQDLLRRMNLPP